MFLGIDVSRRDVATILMQADGAVVLALRAPLPLNSDSVQTWKLAMETAQETLIRSQIERAQIKGAACALDAVFDANGIVQRGVLAEGWHDFDIPRALRETLSIRNTRAASRIWCESLAEGCFGVWRGFAGNALYLHVGARLGAVIRTKSSTRNANDESSSNESSSGANSVVQREIAWGELCIERDGALGSSGRRGTLEAYCTEDNFLARAAGYGITSQNAAEVWAQSGSGFAARSVCDDFVRRLAQGVGNAITLLQPLQIVLGGSLTNALGETLLAPLRSSLREFCDVPTDFVLQGTQLARDAAVLGAVALAMEGNK